MLFLPSFLTQILRYNTIPWYIQQSMDQLQHIASENLVSRNHLSFDLIKTIFQLNMNKNT